MKKSWRLRYLSIFLAVSIVMCSASLPLLKVKAEETSDVVLSELQVYDTENEQSEGNVKESETLSDTEPVSGDDQTGSYEISPATTNEEEGDAQKQEVSDIEEASNPEAVFSEEEHALDGDTRKEAPEIEDSNSTEQGQDTSVVEEETIEDEGTEDDTDEIIVPEEPDDKVINQEASMISSIHECIRLTVNQNIIAQDGVNQDVQCSAFALAYCVSILSGQYANAWDYWNGSYCEWSWAPYGFTSTPYSSSEVLVKCFDEIQSGHPSIIGVRGNISAWDERSYLDHYVVVVGYRPGSRRDQLSISDFIAIDPGTSYYQQYFPLSSSASVTGQVVYPTQGGVAVVMPMSGTAPIGYLDKITPNEDGSIYIEGWAFDYDEKNTNLELHVYVGGAAGSGTGTNYKVRCNGDQRDDVDSTFGSIGRYHGFKLTIPVNERGRQPVYIYAIDVGSQFQGNPEIWSGSVTIPDTTCSFRITGQLEGESTTRDDISGLGTYDISKTMTSSGSEYWSKLSNDTTKYSGTFSTGTKWKVDDIKAASGYRYNGAYTKNSYGTSVSEITETLTGNTVLVLRFSPVKVTSVNLNKTSLALNVGASEKLTATVNPSDALNRDITWSSSNSNVAAVDSSGNVTGKAKGTATITVKTNDGGYTAKCTVTVTESTVPVTGISLNKTALSLKKNASEKLTATVAPSNATNTSVTWSSSNTSVAEVASDGTVTAKAEGTATITVKTTDGGKTATCTVTVTEEQPAPVDPQPTGQKNGWYLENGSYFWYEKGERQGTTGRGKEIYFSGKAGISNPGGFPAGWYWLDAIQGGARAVSKDVYQESKAGPWADRADGTGKWVRYDATGQIIKGWQTTNGKTYYFDKTYGTMAKGYASIDGAEYYFSPSTGVLQQNLGTVPKMGWKRIDGKDYWYENYQRQGVSNAKGYRGKEIYFSGKSGIANPNGLPAGWYWLDNVYGGAKAANNEVYMPYTINGKDNIGKWVRYDATGQLIKGWYETGGKRYYYNKTTGAMTKGSAVIDGKTYYFDEKTGVLQ